MRNNPTHKLALVAPRADNFINWMSRNAADTKFTGKSLHRPMIYGKSKSVSTVEYVALQNSGQM